MRFSRLNPKHPSFQTHKSKILAIFRTWIVVIALVRFVIFILVIVFTIQIRMAILIVLTSIGNILNIVNIHCMNDMISSVRVSLVMNINTNDSKITSKSMHSTNPAVPPNSQQEKDDSGSAGLGFRV